MNSGRFVFKFVLTLSVAIPAFLLVRDLARPDFAPGNRLLWLALAPALLGAAILFELASVPADDWHARMIGHNSLYCVDGDPVAVAGSVRGCALRAALRRTGKSRQSPEPSAACSPPASLRRSMPATAPTTARCSSPPGTRSASF